MKLLPLVSASCFSLLLCACAEPESASQSEETVVSDKQPDVNAATAARGWAGVFASPAKVIDKLNDFGFGNSVYKQANFPPPAYISTGTLIDLSADGEAAANNTGVYVYGASAEQIDEIRFKLNLNSPSLADGSKPRFRELLAGFFKEFGASGLDKVDAALKADRSQTYDLDGANMEVRRAEFPNNTPNARSLLFIIHRPGVTLQD